MPIGETGARQGMTDGTGVSPRHPDGNYSKYIQYSTRAIQYCMSGIARKYCITVLYRTHFMTLP